MIIYGYILSRVIFVCLNKDMNSTIKNKKKTKIWTLLSLLFFYNRMFGSTSLRAHRLIRNSEFDDRANHPVPQSISNCLVFFLFSFTFCVDKAHLLSKRIENFSTGTDGEETYKVPTNFGPTSRSHANDPNHLLSFKYFFKFPK